MYFELDNDDMESTKRRSIFISLISFLSVLRNLLLSDIYLKKKKKKKKKKKMRVTDFVSEEK